MDDSIGQGCSEPWSSAGTSIHSTITATTEDAGFHLVTRWIIAAVRTWRARYGLEEGQDMRNWSAPPREPTAAVGPQSQTSVAARVHDP